jgi:hypothetical protein
MWSMSFIKYRQYKLSQNQSIKTGLFDKAKQMYGRTNMTKLREASNCLFNAPQRILLDIPPCVFAFVQLYMCICASVGEGFHLKF